MFSRGSVNVSRYTACMINLMRSQGWAQTFSMIYVISLPSIAWLWCILENWFPLRWRCFVFNAIGQRLLFIGAFMCYIMAACLISIFKFIHAACISPLLPHNISVCRHHINNCVCAWCSSWGRHPAVNREQSALSPSLSPSLSLSLSLLCLSIFLSVLWLQSGAAAAAVCDMSQWEEQLPLFCLKKWRDVFLELLQQGWIWLPALHNLPPSAWTDK